MGSSNSKMEEWSKITSETSTLRLSRMNLQPEDGRAIGEILKSNTTIVHLILASNNLGPQGGSAIGEALKQNQSVTHLNLSFNGIGTQGAKKIAEALRVNHTLTHLSLGGNDFGEEGEIAICEAIKFNPNLTLLDGFELNKYLPNLSLPIEFKNIFNHDILAYLKELKRYPTSSIMYRMRIMLIGPGEAGKSTLVHKILTGNFTLNQFSRTDGISMKEWKTFYFPPGNPIPLQIHASFWDFGGQEVYLNSHPFLFSDQTLYLLMWNPRVPITTKTLEEYLLNIRSRSKTAPIVLVTTHCSESPSPPAGGAGGGGVTTEEEMKILKYIAEKSAVPSSLSSSKTDGPPCNLSQQDDPDPIDPSVTSDTLNVVKHFAIDSSTGDGIETLKTSLIELVTKEYAHYSRQEVPHWYLDVESKIRQESSNGKFSMTQKEFLTLCSSCWSSPSSSPSSNPLHSPNGDGNGGGGGGVSAHADSVQRMKTVLYLFHHWGVVFVLPKKLSSRHHYGVRQKPDPALDLDLSRDGGDIVLNPQQLADVLKCVITSNEETITTSSATHQLFNGGLLNHNILRYIWSEYDATLHPQLLCLLHDCELAYEIFDHNGNSTFQSLVPSLLHEPPASSSLVPLHRLKEKQIREKFSLDSGAEGRGPNDMPWKSSPSPCGYVKIVFDSLLSNFFPKLLVRLRHLTSIENCSRRHCVIHEKGPAGSRLGSTACVIEDLEGCSLLIYPGGCSYGAITLAHQAIRGLMNESFAGMTVEEITYFHSKGRSYDHQQIVSALLSSSAAAPSPGGPSTASGGDDHDGLSFDFLSCLFVELDLLPLLSAATAAATAAPAPANAAAAPANAAATAAAAPANAAATAAAAPANAAATVAAPANSAAARDFDWISSSISSLTPKEQQTLALLQQHLLKYEQESNQNIHRFVLIHTLLESIPIFRQHGLMLHPHPNILWLVGRSPSAYLLYGVSPSLDPCSAWEIVRGSEILIADDNSCPSPAPFPFCPSSTPLATRLSEVMLRSLKLLLPYQQLPFWFDPKNQRVEWIGLVDCSCSTIQHLISTKEEDYFLPEKNIFGSFSSYSKTLFERQIGHQLRAEDKNLSAEERTMKQLHKDLKLTLKNNFQQLRHELLASRSDLPPTASRATAASPTAVESLEEVRERLLMRMQRLESLIQSTSPSCEGKGDEIESLIMTEMEKMTQALELKLFALGENLSPVPAGAPAGAAPAAVVVVNGLQAVCNQLVWGCQQQRGERGEQEQRKMQEMLSELLEEIKHVVREELRR